MQKNPDPTFHFNAALHASILSLESSSVTDLYKVQYKTRSRLLSRVSDPHHFNANPDAAFHFNAALHASILGPRKLQPVIRIQIRFNAEPDSDTHHFNADPI